MNLTFGDLIFLEIALVHYIQNLDLSMQCGQFVTELIGKIEYDMAQIKQAAGQQGPQGLDAPQNLTDAPVQP